MLTAEQEPEYELDDDFIPTGIDFRSPPYLSQSVPTDGGTHVLRSEKTYLSLSDKLISDDLTDRSYQTHSRRRSASPRRNGLYISSQRTIFPCKREGDEPKPPDKDSSFLLKHRRDNQEITGDRHPSSKYPSYYGRGDGRRGSNPAFQRYFCEECKEWKSRSKFSANQLSKLRGKKDNERWFVRLRCTVCTTAIVQADQIRECSLCGMIKSAFEFSKNNRNGTKATCESCMQKQVDLTANPLDAPLSDNDDSDGDGEKPLEKVNLANFL